LKLLVTGASGLLGHKVAQLAIEKGHEVYSTYKEHPTNLGKPIKLELTNQSQVFQTINRLRPRAIVHTAGATRVGRHKFALKLGDVFNLNRDLIKPAKMGEMPWRTRTQRLFIERE